MSSYCEKKRKSYTKANTCKTYSYPLLSFPLLVHITEYHIFGTCIITLPVCVSICFSLLKVQDYVMFIYIYIFKNTINGYWVLQKHRNLNKN